MLCACKNWRSSITTVEVNGSTPVQLVGSAVDRVAIEFRSSSITFAMSETAPDFIGGVLPVAIGQNIEALIGPGARRSFFLHNDSPNAIFVGTLARSPWFAQGSVDGDAVAVIEYFEPLS